jgi:TIR domain
MSEVVPYFFFSYSQGDSDPYLDQFFEDLRKRVAVLLGKGINFETDPDKEEKLDRIGFRDRYSIQTGQDWMDKIGSAIQRSGALVCIYSPNFFSPEKTKQFCGREFAAFLMRNPEIRYVRGTGEPEQVYQLHGARNIVPIVWWKLRHLQRHKLPPYVLRLIKWDLGLNALSAEVRTRYLDVGLHRIAIEARGDYDDILDHFAELIIELAKRPLPPMDTLPDIEKVRNAFWDPPEADRIDGAKAAVALHEEMITVETRGPTRMLAIQVQPKGDTADWTPYAGECGIRALFEEIANQKELSTDWMTFDPGSAEFIEMISSALSAAAKDSIRSILVVDPYCLANETWRGALVKLLHQPCRAGFLVPADTADLEAMSLVEQYRTLLQPAVDAPDWLVRISIGNIAQFRTAVSSVADDILARIVKNDPVRQKPPDNAGPTSLPRIASRL